MRRKLRRRLLYVVLGAFVATTYFALGAFGVDIETPKMRLSALIEAREQAYFLLAVCLGLIVVATRLILIGRRSEHGLNPLSPAVVILAVLIAAGSTGALTFWLFRIATSGPPNPSVQIDAVRTGLGAAAGAGGAIALILAARRQWTSEVTSVAHIRDANEKRNLELYNKAVEQLGSAASSVQLGAVYSLEKLGQENKDYRQTVTNLLASYLRNPSSFEAGGAGPAVPKNVNKSQRSRLQVRAQQDSTFTAAQSILEVHLDRTRDFSGEFWPGMSIDLAGTNFGRVDFSQWSVTTADFSNCSFLDSADFNRFSCDASSTFQGAKFRDTVDFRGSQFGWDTSFEGVKFNNSVNFENCHFHGNLLMTAGRFDGPVSMAGVTVDLPILSRGILGVIGPVADRVVRGGDFLPLLDGLLASFADTLAEGGLALDDSVFAGSVDLSFLRCRGTLAMCNATFRKAVNLDGMYSWYVELENTRIDRESSFFSTWSSLVGCRDPDPDQADKSWRYFELDGAARDGLPPEWQTRTIRMPIKF